MKCPSCGNEMEPGRLTAGGYWIRWVSEEDVLPVTVSRLSLSSKGVCAWICQACRKLIADY